jgi:hypothetical protein
MEGGAFRQPLLPGIPFADNAPKTKPASEKWHQELQQREFGGSAINSRANDQSGIERQDARCAAQPRRTAPDQRRKKQVNISAASKPAAEGRPKKHGHHGRGEQPD